MNEKNLKTNEYDVVKSMLNHFLTDPPQYEQTVVGLTNLQFSFNT